MQDIKAVRNASKANAIAAITKDAVKSVTTNATIKNIIKTIAETKTGLSNSLCKAIEKIITASGNIKKNSIVKSIGTQPF